MAKKPEPISNKFAVDGKKLMSHIDQLTNMKKAISEKAGDLRSTLKQILETEGYHKGAMKIVRDIDAMSDQNRADMLRTFDPMYQAMKAGKWDDASKDMLEELAGDQ